MVSWWWGVILGFIIALSTMSMAGRYVSLFFMASGYVGKALIPQGHEFTEKVGFRKGFALTLVWLSNAIPRPPAYVNPC